MGIGGNGGGGANGATYPHPAGAHALANPPQLAGGTVHCAVAGSYVVAGGQAMATVPGGIGGGDPGGGGGASGGTGAATDIAGGRTSCCIAGGTLTVPETASTVEPIGGDHCTVPSGIAVTAGGRTVA